VVSLPPLLASLMIPIELDNFMLLKQALSLAGSSCKCLIARKKERRGANPRIKITDDIKDEDLKRELKDGAQLVSYSSTYPIWPNDESQSLHSGFILSCLSRVLPYI
jgi:hypothetical protein